MNICACFQSSDLLINCFKSQYYDEIYQIDRKNSKSNNQNLKKFRSNKRKLLKLLKHLTRIPEERIKLSLKNLREKKTLIR